LEQDYWKLREVETRYRLLFETSNEPVLLLSADNARIVESNAAALRVLGLQPGQELLPELSVDERDRLEAMLDMTRARGTAPSLVVQLGPDRQRWLVRFSLITSSEARPLFLLRFAAVLVGEAQSADDLVTAADLFERLSDGFVLLDRDGLVLRANQPFRDLIEATAQDAQLAALEITDGSDITRMAEMLESVRSSVTRTAELLEHLIWHASSASMTTRCSSGFPAFPLLLQRP
jgi:PAS domain-containing protein